MITPAQCRAARGLINWSQKRLAEVSHLGESTLRNFEAGRGTPSHNNMSAVKASLENAGVVFVETGVLFNADRAKLGQRLLDNNMKLTDEQRSKLTRIKLKLLEATGADDPSVLLNAMAEAESVFSGVKDELRNKQISANRMGLEISANAANNSKPADTVKKKA